VKGGATPEIFGLKQMFALGKVLGYTMPVEFTCRRAGSNAIAFADGPIVVPRQERVWAAACSSQP